MLATTLEATGYPSCSYIGRAKRGKQPAKTERTKPWLAWAEEEYVSYASAR